MFRVIIFTALLWAGAVYLFVLASSQMFVTICDGINLSDAYTCTEF